MKRINYRRFYLVIGSLLAFPLFQYAQKVTYKEPFAPNEKWVKAPEQSYRQDICLNGLWQFQPVALPAGFKEGYDVAPALPAINVNNWDKSLIRIPSPWNVNSFANVNGQGGDFRCYPSYPVAWENIKMGWLRKTVTVPADWKGKNIRLHFEAVAGEAEIIVNGKKAGSHFGIFLPFDINVTDFIIAGKENEICIGIRKASLFDKRSDYGRRTYQAGSFWGQHIAGIWQDVFLVAVPTVNIDNVFIKPLLDSSKLLAELTISNTTNRPVKVMLSAQVFPWRATNDKGVPSVPSFNKVVLTMPAVAVTIPAHSTVKKSLATAVKDQLQPWWPDQPRLYSLVVKATIDGRDSDAKYTRFGWRQTSFNGSAFLLNGKPFVMKGDSWHFMGIPQMTRRYAWAWYKAVKDANLNAVRLHAQPYPSFYLDMADEMGILVLDETAVWASDGGPKLDTTAYWKDSESHLTELIQRDRNHPSVIGWSVSNEVMPIVRGVMRNPPGMRDTLVKYYGVWAAICRQLDPTRPWISADGEDDGDGKLPTYIVHYGGLDAMNRAAKNGKPWGVGEAGNAYYGTPQQVAETNGDRAYESFLGRMEGVAESSYQSLMAQRERNAVYRSVFNMVWYGLKPLPFGKKDIARPPSADEGIFFTYFKEGEPGVQPERLGPYCSTLNPGYDPSLPLYETWPLFNAIHDASAEPAITTPWAVQTKKNSTAVAPVVPVATIKLLGGKESKLLPELKRTGVSFSADNAQVPSLLFIDGEEPPAADAKTIIEKVYANGGAVVVWGVTENKLAVLNELLPAPIAVTSRTTSSLLTNDNDIITTGVTAADLYFSELRPPAIITHGLDGPLVKQSSILLQAANTDWLKWNKQAEYAKTAMVLRSELESKPSGAALIMKKMGSGRLVVTTLPAAPRLAKAEKAVRMILANLGVPLGAGSDVGKPLRKSGDIVRALFAGSFPVGSIREGADKNFIDPSGGDMMKAGVASSGKTWNAIYEENGMIDFSKINMDGPRNNAVAYLSFWVSSPRDLSDLLIEPNIPVVNMEVNADDAAQVWLNGKMIINGAGNMDEMKTKANALKLHQGWNHFLVKVIQTGGGWQFSGRLTCNQPDFLAALESALEKP